jgi:hypothetical protein
MRMLTVTTVLLLAMAGVLAACHAEHEHSHEAHGELRLDNGAKWQADQHTRDSVARMNGMLGEKTDLNEPERKALGGRLQSELQVLIRGCTMTGEAHSQLHIFLNRYLPAVDALAEGGDQQALENVVRLLSEYERHFE